MPTDGRETFERKLVISAPASCDRLEGDNIVFANMVKSTWLEAHLQAERGKHLRCRALTVSAHCWCRRCSHQRLSSRHPHRLYAVGVFGKLSSNAFAKAFTVSRPKPIGAFLGSAKMPEKSIRFANEALTRRRSRRSAVNLALRARGHLVAVDHGDISGFGNSSKPPGGASGGSQAFTAVSVGDIDRRLGSLPAAL